MYTKTVSHNVVSDYYSPALWLLRDEAPDTLTEAEYRKHLGNIHAFLLHRIEHLTDDEFILDSETEAQLTRIFRSLLRAKLNVQNNQVK